jgi:hypothetical protein
MSEILKENPGFAIIARFRYSDSSRQKVEGVDQYSLTPGSGIVFSGKGDSDSHPTFFSKQTLDKTLQSIPPSDIQLIVFLDDSLGGLLFTDGTKENSYGINQNSEVDTLTANYGRLSFAGIFASNEKHARAKLRKKISTRLRMN